MELGDKVTYIRQDSKLEELFEGEGKVVGIFYNPADKPMVNVKDGDETYTVDMATINAPEGFLNTYEETLEKVKQVSKEGNDKVTEIVTDYNKRVDDLYAELLEV